MTLLKSKSSMSLALPPLAASAFPVANFSKPSPTSKSSLSSARFWDFLGLPAPALSLRALSSFSAVCFDNSIAF